VSTDYLVIDVGMVPALNLKILICLLLQYGLFVISDILKQTSDPGDGGYGESSSLPQFPL